MSNLLETLVKLRDDIKTWVTNNITALNNKIDEKTIPIDSELDSNSTNPVQNKTIATEITDINNRVGTTSVATQISNAIAKQPHFSGDYNDLTNAPNIVEDDGGNMVITDESGNIIFKVDANGAHTTKLTLNEGSAATEDYVKNAIANIKYPTTDLTGYATEAYVDNKVADLVNSAPEALDTLGELATALENHEDAYDALLETVGSKATKTELADMKTELSESIISESDEFYIVDNNGNIVASINENGVTTTTVTAQSLIVNGDNVESHIDNTNIHVTTQDKEKWNNKSDFSGSYNDLTDKPDIYTKTEVDDAIANVDVDLTGYATTQYVDDAISEIDIPVTDLTNYYTKTETDTAITSAKEELSESIVAESDEWKVVDEAGNIIFSVDANGAHTTALNLIDGPVATEKYVDDAVSNKIIDTTNLAKINENNIFQGINEFTGEQTYFNGEFRVDWIDSRDEPGRLYCVGNQAEFTLGDQMAGMLINHDEERGVYETAIWGDNISLNAPTTQCGEQLTIGLRGAGIGDAGDYLEIHDSNNVYLIAEHPDGDSSYIDIFTDHIEYTSPSHDFSGKACFTNAIFNGEADFSNATITGLPVTLGGSGLQWSEDLITNQVDLSGKILKFDTTTVYPTNFSWSYGTLCTSSGGYELYQGGPPNLEFRKNGETLQTLYTYTSMGVGTWHTDKLILPDDFGYITQFGVGSTSASSAIEVLNAMLLINIIKVGNALCTVDVDFTNANVIGLPESDIDTSNFVTLEGDATLSNKKISSDGLSILNPGGNSAGVIKYGNYSGLESTTRWSAPILAVSGTATSCSPNASDKVTVYGSNGIAALGSDNARYLITFPNQSSGTLATQEWVAANMPSGAEMSYKEIRLSNMYTTTTNSANNQISGTVYIRAWLPDTIEITDFAGVVSALTSLGGGTALNSCAHPAYGIARSNSSVNYRILYVCPTSTGGLQLLGLNPNGNDTTNNTMEYFSVATALRGDVTVTTLMEGGTTQSVIANPTLYGSEDNLTSITVNGVAYKVPTGNYVLELTGESGTLTDEQYQAVIDNFPNVIIQWYEGDPIDYPPVYLKATSRYFGYMFSAMPSIPNPAGIYKVYSTYLNISSTGEKTWSVIKYEETQGVPQYNLSTVLTVGQEVPLNETDSLALASIMSNINDVLKFQNVGVVVTQEEAEGHQPFIGLDIKTDFVANQIIFSYQSFIYDLDIVADLNTGVIKGKVMPKSQDKGTGVATIDISQTGASGYLDIDHVGVIEEKFPNVNIRVLGKYIYTALEFDSATNTYKFVNVSTTDAQAETKLISVDANTNAWAFTQYLADLGGLPEVTSENAGEVLTVNEQGEWQAQSLPMYDGENQGGTTGGGLAKTKVTLAELQALLTEDNVGTQVFIRVKPAIENIVGQAVYEGLVFLGIGNFITVISMADAPFIACTNTVYAQGELNSFSILIALTTGNIATIQKYVLATNTASEPSSLSSVFTDEYFEFYIYK